MKRNIFSIVFLCVILNNYAQQNNVSTYLEDGGYSDIKDLIKTDITEYLKSNIQIIWEHKINNNLSIETGFGYLAHNIYKPILNKDIIKGSTIYDNLNGGVSFLISPVLYNEGLESFRFSFPFKVHYHFNQAISYEFNFGIGKQWFLNRKLSLNIGSGLGLNFETSLDDYSYIFDENLRYNINSVKDDIGIRLIIPLEVRIGYIF